MNEDVVRELSPEGVLRAGINMSNFLLVTGRGANGEPQGVSPGMAAALAKELGVELQLIAYEGPGEVADGVGSKEWDIGNIAAEAERAKTIAFSPAYCEIQATYMLPGGTHITRLEDVDKPGNRISVKDRSAYDLWLTDNLQHATLVRSASIDESFERFLSEGLEVLAGLRPALLRQQESQPSCSILDKSFTAIQQSMGCQQGKPAAAVFVAEFVRRSIANGLVESLIEEHGVQGRLSVAPLADIVR